MDTTSHANPRQDLAVAAMLAQLLERLEHSAQPVGPEQYRSVVQHLVRQFDELSPGDEIKLLLDRYPAASELYENLHYEQAGLCRSGLETAMAAELRAREVIARAMRRPEPGSIDVQN